MPLITRLRRRDGLFHVHPARLADAPRIAVLPAGEGEGVTTIAVRGLFCGVCAQRTEAALRSVPGVQSATVDLDAAQATVRLSPGAHVEPQRLQQALERVVIGMPVRRLIERTARLVRRL